jgi:hypothetical protein
MAERRASEPIEEPILIEPGGPRFFDQVAEAA